MAKRKTIVAYRWHAEDPANPPTRFEVSAGSHLGVRLEQSPVTMVMPHQGFYWSRNLHSLQAFAAGRVDQEIDLLRKRLARLEADLATMKRAMV